MVLSLSLLSVSVSLLTLAAYKIVQRFYETPAQLKARRDLNDAPRRPVKSEFSPCFDKQRRRQI
jgi:hypothetical protein